MKRLSRRSRALGQTVCDDELLDDETKKQLLASAGITCEVLEEMSVEERQGTLKAILASNPALLPQAEKVNGAGSKADIDRVDSSDSLSMHSYDSSLSSTGSDCPVVGQAGRQLRLRSPVCKKSHSTPSLPGDRVQVPQIMAVDRTIDKDLPSATFLKKPAKLVLDSDEEKVDEEEETQPYDLGCLVASSEVSLLSGEQELLMGETIPETQTVDSNLETNSEDEAGDIPHILKPVESSGTHETVRTTSTSLRSLGLQQDMPLTRIYRTHQNPEKTLWPSLYAPHSVQNPGLYTDVIKFVLDIYMRRICRAQKQSEQVARPWGKPVSAGCHVKGCLWARSSRLQDEQARGTESKRGRTLRLRYPQNEGSSAMNKQGKYDEDDDDFEVKLPQTIKQDVDWYQRLQEEQAQDIDSKRGRTLRRRHPQNEGSSVVTKQGKYDVDDDFEVKLPQTLKQDMDLFQRVQSKKQIREVHDEMSGMEAVTGRKQNQCSVIDEPNEDVVGSEKDGNESDEWIPVKVTRGSDKRKQTVTRGNRQHTRSRLLKNKTREHGDNADSNHVTLSKNIAGASRTVKQVNHSRVEVDMSVDRCEFESMLRGREVSGQQKYVWSDEEEEVVACQVGSGDASVRGNRTFLSVRGNKQSQDAHVKVGRVIALDKVAENLNTDLVVEEELSQQQCEGDRTVAGLMAEISTFNQGPSNSQSNEGTTSHEKFDALVVDVSSSQSCESLLDGQGNLYSTQLPSSSHNTDSHLASTSSVQRSRRQGQNTSRVRAIASSRHAGQPSISGQDEVKSQKDEKLSVGQASAAEDQSFSHIISRPGIKQKNTRNPSRNNDASDDRDQVKAVSNHVNDPVVFKDNNCDVKQDGKPLSSVRCLKRHPVVVIQEDKRRRLDVSSTLNKSNSYDVTETCSTKLSAESSSDCRGRPLTPTLGRLELMQDDTGSVADSMCPICGQYFHPSKLEAHASSCGDDVDMSAEGDSHDEIRCLKCLEKIPQENIKEHQSHCVNMDVPSRRLTRSNRE